MQRTSLQNRSLAYTLNLLVYMQLLKDMKAKLRKAAEERETHIVSVNTTIAYNSEYEVIASMSETMFKETARTGREHSFTVCKADDKYYPTNIRVGTENRVDIDDCPQGYETVSYTHTHPIPLLQILSGADIREVLKRGKPVNLITGDNETESEIHRGTPLEITEEEKSKLEADLAEFDATHRESIIENGGAYSDDQLLDLEIILSDYVDNRPMDLPKKQF
jgi:hypothetical protein